jgi:hypothetical protein
MEAALVRSVGIRMESLRSTPGANTSSVARDPPRSTGVKLSLTLTQSTAMALIDVACTQDRVAISLRLPDRTVVNRENAQANGLDWQEFRYPPDLSGGGPFGAPFAAAFIGSMTLPVDGMHYQIQFPSGVRQAGTYTVEADGRQSTATAEVSMMFVPVESVSQRVTDGFQRLASPTAK